MARSTERGNRDQGTSGDVLGQWARKIEPRVQDALAGKIKVPPQEPWTEAWIALALYWGAAPLTLQGILQNADIVNHAFPNPDEIAWALLMLRRRNWLSERENM